MGTGVGGGGESSGVSGTLLPLRSSPPRPRGALTENPPKLSLCASWHLGSLPTFRSLYPHSHPKSGLGP